MRRPADGSRAVRCAGKTAGIARLAGIMAGALLLAYAVAFPAPVQAQSTDPVWSTMMTVGVATNGNRGFSTSEDDPAYDYGSMGVDDFHGGSRHLLTCGIWPSTDQWSDLLQLIQVDGSDTNLSNQGDYFLEWAGEMLPLSAVFTASWIPGLVDI